MKNIMKKITVLTFSIVFSLSAFGMIDHVYDKKVKLSDKHDIEIKESVKNRIKSRNVALEKVAKLYNVSMEDPSTYCSSDETILICKNQLMYMFISKSDDSILDFMPIDEEN